MIATTDKAGDIMPMDVGSDWPHVYVHMDLKTVWTRAYHVKSMGVHTVLGVLRRAILNKWNFKISATLILLFPIFFIS